MGASIRISWIGQTDAESGFMTGSHVYNATPFTLNDDLIEEGYMPIRARPHEGIRLVYMPKDDADLEFTPVQAIIEGNSNTAANTQTVDA